MNKSLVYGAIAFISATLPVVLGMANINNEMTNIHQSAYFYDSTQLLSLLMPIILFAKGNSQEWSNEELQQLTSQSEILSGGWKIAAGAAIVSSLLGYDLKPEDNVYPGVYVTTAFAASLFLSRLAFVKITLMQRFKNGEFGNSP